MPKTNIHPEYKPSTITCACGNVFDTFSTRGSFMVEICSNCHPFYTGKQKILDTAGRIDRFNKKYGRGAGAAQKSDKAAERAGKQEKAEPEA